VDIIPPVGGFSSIAIDSSDYAHISYRALDSDLRYATNVPTQPPYPPNSHAAVYGADSVIGSGLGNQIALIFIPLGAVIFLKILRKKR